MRESKRLIIATIGIISIFTFVVNISDGGDPLKNINGISDAEKKAEEDYRKNNVELNKSAAVATYGKLPELKTEDQKWNWTYKTQPAIIEGLKDRITLYFSPKGPLVVFGTDPNGYFVAVINNSLTIERPLLDEIYGLIDEEAKKRGIHDVPVMFFLGSVQPLVGMTVGTSNKDPPLLENKTTPMPTIPKEVSNKPVQGFGLSYGLITLLCVWLFRRRSNI
ncbi:MAG: hypothetical protein FIB08_07710 [Candidatus Methanoperedens sp.]|nr:hypothetical protein [Candidatus Methanoperedens sp.]